MQKLYLDCDGVILDTVSKDVYDRLKYMGIDTQDKVRDYFSNLNWDDYIEECGQINNSIEKIKFLSNYFDIEILTHVNSEEEGLSKKRYFTKMLPSIKVNTVPKSTNKGDFVNPEGSILVDDFIPNLDYWALKGGIGVKFSDSGKECDYVTITDLLDLMNVNYKVRCKTEVK